MRIVGITGGIGAGKSVVSRILRLKGFEVYDCDHHARRIMNADGVVKVALIDRYGEECYLGDGSLNKAFLADKIFKEDKERLWVNSLVHSAVKDDFSEKIGCDEHEIVFLESAIIATSGLDKICSEIWLVEADDDVRLCRAFERGGIEPADIRRRMDAQRKEFDSLPDSKVRIIKNTGKESLLSQIENLL